MSKAIWTLPGLALALAGCPFNPKAIDTLALACVDSAECPAGQQCLQPEGTEYKRCVAVADPDAGASGDAGLADAGGATDAGTGLCDNGAKDGDETDTDCGGSCGETCKDGARCGDGHDCLSGVCEADEQGVRRCLCGDLEQDNGEAGVDCGGDFVRTRCPGCVDGVVCNNDGDCASGHCSDYFTPAQCACGNGTVDGDESDTDCGGATCPGCKDGQSCRGDIDCANGTAGSCLEWVCRCSDGEYDDSESDTDCGGPHCSECADKQSCFLNSDCSSGYCLVIGAIGQCLTCIPDCTAKGCGNDGCGGACANCGASEACIEVTCVGCPSTPCTCSTAGCRGPCGTCAETDHYCSALGNCELLKNVAEPCLQNWECASGRCTGNGCGEWPVP